MTTYKIGDIVDVRGSEYSFSGEILKVFDHFSKLGVQVCFIEDPDGNVNSYESIEIVGYSK